MKKTLSVLLAICMLLCVLAGCNKTANSDDTTDANQSATTDETQDSSNQTSDGEPTTVRVRMATLASLSPFGTGVSEAAICECCECLFEIDGFGGSMIPVMADASKGEFGGYDHEDGSSDYTVYIYDYITDAAGNKITASDVKWSFENNTNYDVDGWGAFESVEVVDDTTMIFHFANELTGLGELENIWCRCFIFSEKAYNDSPSKFASDLCGTGPYKITDYVAGVSITLQARNDYWQTDDSLRQIYQQANVDTIEFDIIGEEAQTIIALQDGQLDIATEITAINLTQFADGGAYSDDYNVYSYSHNAVYYLAPNCSANSLCGDVNMRKALFYAVDQDGLVAAMGADSVSKVNCFCSNLFGDYQSEWDNADNYNTVFDLDTVKEYLEKANYNGETLKLICGNASTTAAQVLVQMWDNAGIKVTMEGLDQASMGAIQTDDSAWDIELNARGSSDYCVNVWAHYFDTAQSDTGLTTNFIDDSEWADMLSTCCSLDGHTPENIKAWWDHCTENAYGMGLYSSINNIVHSNAVREIVRTDKNQVMPGACTYNF